MHKELTLEEKKQKAVNNKKWYEAHKPEIAERRKIYKSGRKVENAKYARDRYAIAKKSVLTHYSNSDNARCIICGVNDIDVLCLDHINNNGKVDRVRFHGSGALYRHLERNGFPEGYQTLCFNCNMKKHISRLRDDIFILALI